MPVVRKGKKPLGQYLVEKGIVTQEQLRAALEEQRKSGLYLREVFQKLGFVKEDDILSFFEDELNIPRVSLSDYSVDPEIIKLVPEKLARRHRLIPLFRIKDTLTVAMEDPLNVIAIDEVGSATGMDIDPCICTHEDINLALKRYYGAGGSLDIIDPAVREDLKAEDAENRIIKFVEEIIKKATEEKASDIHIEPDEDKLRIRFRVDGVLKEVSVQPKSIHPAVVSRIKVLSDLDIAEKRLPQDGRFQMQLEDRVLDLRVSTFPTVQGENVVIRVLDKKNAVIKLDDLGLEQRDLDVLRSMIVKPNGIILVTGPTGSGKTSTLYAALQEINTLDRNIATLEDPVEYMLPYVRQTQVNEDVGFTFARGLRSLVRQDPDVIMVGEIRDRESAEIAIRSALTGHLVFSTLHTNDAIGAIARLVDMGIEPFLIASSLIGVIAQRLLRRICARCSEPYDIPRDSLAALQIELKDGDDVRKGKGCMLCSNTGYRGRVAVFEILQVTEEIKKAVLENASFDRMKALARKTGMRTLREDAVSKALRGITTIEEVLRMTKDEADDIARAAGVGDHGKEAR
jgi:type IV pilus assembly protein PilB